MSSTLSKRVATAALDRLKQRSEPETRRWAPALLFNIGNSQMCLGHSKEGLASLRNSLDGIRQYAEESGNADEL